MSEKTYTTARVLADYRSDLIAGGFDRETAEAMARDAADILIRNNGLVVGDLDRGRSA